MTLPTSRRAAPPTAALSFYELAVSLSDTGVHVAWQDIADRLRAEAAELTGGQRRKRIDRALICETKALAQRTADAFRREERARAIAKAMIAALPDFVQVGAYDANDAQNVEVR